MIDKLIPQVMVSICPDGRRCDIDPHCPPLASFWPLWLMQLPTATTRRTSPQDADPRHAPSSHPVGGMCAKAGHGQHGKPVAQFPQGATLPQWGEMEKTIYATFGHFLGYLYGNVFK